jgi:hypothetical protein
MPMTLIMEVILKGVIFVELLSMAESLIGEEAVDQVLDSTDLANGGAFTSVGNYPCSELMKLVEAFSAHTGHSVAFLKKTFGAWIFAHFHASYEHFFTGKQDAFSMLEAIEDEVHVEVRKLYSEVDLPRFLTERIGDDTLVMTYYSERPLIDFCEGMIQACLDHFGQTGTIERVLVPSEEGFGARFTIKTTTRLAA